MWSLGCYISLFQHRSSSHSYICTVKMKGRHNMHCASHRTTCIPEEVDSKSSLLSMQIKEKDNINSSSKDTEGWRDPHCSCRCALVTILTVAPDGQLKLFVPVGHGSHVNQVGSAVLANSLTAPQCRNKGTGNTEQKARKRYSRKKGKKKGKQKKKLSREIRLSGSESIPEGGASQTGGNSDIHRGLAPLAPSSPGNSGNEEEKNTIDHSCTSSTDEACVAGSTIPSTLPKCSSDLHISQFDVGIQNVGVQDIEHGRIISTNCEEKFDSDHKHTLCNQETDAVDLLSSPDCVGQEECRRNIFNDTTTTAICKRETNCGRQLCHLDVLEKRVKKNRRGPKNPSVCNVSSSGNLHCPSWWETNYSVWKKVQNSDAWKRNHDSSDVNIVLSQVENKSETRQCETPMNAVNSNLTSDSEIKKQTKTSTAAKKSNFGSKQEPNCCYREDSQAIRDRSNLCTNLNLQHGESCTVPERMNGENKPDKELGFHSKTNATLVLPTERVESSRLRARKISQAGLNETEPRENSYGTCSSVNDQNADGRAYFPSISCSSQEMSELVEKLSATNLETLVDHEEARVKQVDKKASCTPSAQKKNSSSGAVWQKRMPIGVRNSGINGSILHGGLSVMKIDEAACGSWTPENSSEEDLVSDSCTSGCAACSGPVCTMSIVKEHTESENQNILISDINSSKILSAVVESHRARVASEAIQLATGVPIAEFEKLLHSASPVICTSKSTVSCQTCLRGSFCAFLCQHEVPNISLGDLWQWYEKHGTYGLEVKADDYKNTTRLGIDSVTFRAYFVPYLSAVQLFSKRKVPYLDNGSGNPASAMETNKVVKSSKRNNFSDALSLLVPQPWTEESLITPGDHTCPEPCRGFDELEILFEFFESEQPQRRRPLFEMINELVQGDLSSRFGAYGDGTILNSESMCDLHPRSWYSVAWYPIYKIPEGNFRAAFLTYHSLGLLVPKQPAPDSACMDVSIVTPVVGLQTYNAQDECWFRPRHNADVLNSEPTRILKERLRTLEQTASLMARAVVTKGSQRTTNRQPDYEFFLSRQRS